MLDLRRSAAPYSRARASLAALLIAACAALCAWPAPPAHAATGDLQQLLPGGFDPDKLGVGGPVAIDPDGGSFYVADHDSAFLPRLRKFSKTGVLEGTVAPDTTNASGTPLYVAGLALDSQAGILYVLMDADDHGNGLAREILAYSTTPSGGALVAPGAPAPAAVQDGVLVDFRTAGHAIDYASGIAVDRIDATTSKIAIVGIDDSTKPDPAGVIQYVTDQGAISTTVTPLGAGLDPVDNTGVSYPTGIAIAPGGDVFVGIPKPDQATNGTFAQIYRMPRESGASALFLTDTHEPRVYPFLGGGVMLGSPLAVSHDGQLLYVEEGNSAGSRARGYSTADADPTVVYGYIDPAATTDVPCLVRGANGGGIAAGDGAVFITAALEGPTFASPLVHVFGDGGTGCPTPTGAFAVNGQATGTVTVTKGQTVAFDASGSDLLSASPTRLDWDFDGSGQFATQVTGTPAALTTQFRFTAVGTVQVGVRIHSDGSPTTAPAFRSVKVVAPTPSAAFQVSNRNPAPGAAVAFDASDSVDPAGSPTAGPSHALAKYRWDFGDGSPVQETTGATTSHAFANASAAAVGRTVKLTVVSKDGVASAPAQQTVTVGGTPSDNPPSAPPGTTPSGNGNGNSGTPKATPPKPPVPSVTVGGIDAKGTLSLKVACPAGGAATAGRIALTVKVKKKVKGKAKTTTVTLGTASFSVAAGQSKVVKLKLSSAGWSLLKRQKRLSASAAIAVTGGATASRTVALKAPSKAKKK